MYCKNCGKEIDDNAEICPECGVRTLSPKTPGKLWYILILFGIIGGIIGYIFLKNKDKLMARNILVIGTGISLIGFIFNTDQSKMKESDQKTNLQSGQKDTELTNKPTITLTPVTNTKTPIQTKSGPMVTTTTTQIISTNSSDRYAIVTKIVDGDTIWVDDNEKVRFVGINTPEVGQSGSYDTTQYVSDRILNKMIYLDIDDKNPKDKYDRTLAVININDDNLNQELLCKGYAEIMYIPPSEFDPYSWKSSCPVSTPTLTYTNTPTPTTQTSCDPSYPDFCIPSPPPDLDCKDIQQKKFKVLQPDPHEFDRDNDGIGCEI